MVVYIHGAKVRISNFLRLMKSCRVFLKWIVSNHYVFEAIGYIENSNETSLFKRINIYNILEIASLAINYYEKFRCQFKSAQETHFLNIHLGRVYFILLGIYGDSKILSLIYFINFGKFLAIFSPNIASFSFSSPS